MGGKIGVLEPIRLAGRIVRFEELAALCDQHADKRDDGDREKADSKGRDAVIEGLADEGAVMPPPIVCVKPRTEEAVPATWPSGSIAMALKLAAISPNWNMVAACRSMKAAKAAARSMKPTSR